MTWWLPIQLILLFGLGLFVWMAYYPGLGRRWHIALSLVETIILSGCLLGHYPNWHVIQIGLWLMGACALSLVVRTFHGLVAPPPLPTDPLERLRQLGQPHPPKVAMSPNAQRAIAVVLGLSILLCLVRATILTLSQDQTGSRRLPTVSGPTILI